MDIVCYFPDYDQEHKMVLEAFAMGAKAELRPVTDYRPCDVAVIYGLYKYKVSKTLSKLPIITLHQGPRRLIVIDSSPVMRGRYWQVGWGTSLGGNNDFLNKGSAWDRWHSWGIELRPWQLRGPDAPVIVCGQVPWDANVQDTDHVKWIIDTMRFYNECGQKVLFRPHPKMHMGYGKGVVGVYHTGSLADALAQARVIVTWNSTIGTDAAIAGTPVIAVDKGSFAYDVAGHEILDIQPKLLMFNREQWAANLAYCQWNLDELRTGMAWAHLSR